MKRSPIARSRKPIPRKRKTPRRGPMRDEAYKAWIRRCPCLICVHALGMLRIADFSDIVRSEAAHVGPRGLGQKCSDRETLPLCAAHHRTGPDSAHNLGRKFWSHHKLNREALLAELQGLYEERS